VLRRDVSIKSAFGENPKTVHGGTGGTPATRMGVAWVIRQALEDARHYRTLRGGDTPSVGLDLANEALLRLLDGELQWDVHAHRHDDIATAIRLAEEYGLRLVINHGTEAYKMLDLIAGKALPVVLGPTLSALSKVELKGHDPASAARLTARGIVVALTTDHPEVPIELLVTEAGIAMRDGLSREDALRSICLNAAGIFGLDDRVGAIAPGLDADLVLWSGDPLDVQSVVRRVYVSGRLAYERADS
jgi:imidazolonepropionase-like amidohydrolase